VVVIVIEHVRHEYASSEGEQPADHGPLVLMPELLEVLAGAAGAGA
jgi:hypothetical protein